MSDVAVATDGWPAGYNVCTCVHRKAARAFKPHQASSSACTAAHVNALHHLYSCMYHCYVQLTSIGSNATRAAGGSQQNRKLLSYGLTVHAIIWAHHACCHHTGSPCMLSSYGLTMHAVIRAHHACCHHTGSPCMLSYGLTMHAVIIRAHQAFYHTGSPCMLLSYGLTVHSTIRAHRACYHMGSPSCS